MLNMTIRFSALLFLFINSFLSAQQTGPFTPFEINSKWGFKNATGKIVRPAEFDKEPRLLSCNPLDSLSTAQFWIVVKSKKEGLLDYSLKELLPCSYLSVSGFYDEMLCDCCNNYFSVQNNSGYAVYDSRKRKFVSGFDYLDLTLADYDQLLVVAKKEVKSDTGQVSRTGVILIGDTFKTIIPVCNEVIYRSSNEMGTEWILGWGFFLFKNNGKMGVYDKWGKLLAPFEYEDIDYMSSDGVFILQKSNGKYLANRHGKILYGPLDDIKRPVSYRDSVYYTIIKNGKYALLDRRLNEISPMINDSVEVTYYGNWIRLKQNGKWSLFTVHGKKFELDLTSETEGHNVYYNDSASIYVFKQNEKWGVINNEGKITVKPVFNEVEMIKKAEDDRYSNRVRMLKGFTDEGVCIIDMSGKIIASKPNLEVMDYRKYMKLQCRGVKNKKDITEEALFDWNGKALLPFTEGEYRIWLNGSVAKVENTRSVKKNGNSFQAQDYYAFDTLMRPVNQKPWSFTGAVSDKRVRVNTGGYMNCSGSVNGGTWGYLDEKGEVVIPAKYAYVKDFNNGLAGVYEGGQYNDGAEGGEWKLIDVNGKNILPAGLSLDMEFRPEDNFGFYKTLVYHSETETSVYGLLGPGGKQIFPPVFSDIKSFNGNTSICQTPAGKYGMMDNKGRMIFDTLYDEIEKFCPFSANNDSFLYVLKKDSLYGIYTKGGKAILPMKNTFIKATTYQEYITMGTPGKMGFFSLRTMDWIIKPEFDALFYPGEKYIGVIKDGKSGIINWDGKMLMLAKEKLAFDNSVFLRSR
jgi:hypothetical protein